MQTRHYQNQLWESADSHTKVLPIEWGVRQNRQISSSLCSHLHETGSIGWHIAWSQGDTAFFGVLSGRYRYLATSCGRLIDRRINGETDSSSWVPLFDGHRHTWLRTSQTLSINELEQLRENIFTWIHRIALESAKLQIKSNQKIKERIYITNI